MLDGNDCNKFSLAGKGTVVRRGMIVEGSREPNHVHQALIMKP